jgi:DNA-binding NtrC family response regulator
MSLPETRTHSLSSVSTLETQSFEVVVQGGPDRGKRFSATQGRARLGCGAGNDLVLSDSMISRIHCELSPGEGGLKIRDCGSKNGTFVDGVPIIEARLLPGAIIQMGETSLRVEFGDAPVAVQISPHDRFGPLIGASPEMRRIYTILERVGPTERTVLIQGETGTGKELVARALHEASKRAEGPYVPVDCGAIAENLIESELFGHVRGAYTGANNDRAGLFEQAAGGTLFLDEIGELPLSLQSRLLRAIEAREIRRLGSNKSTPIDVRIVAATHRNLYRAVNDGLFREDLYYRLAVVELRIPPLRARREDIPALAAHFYQRYADGEAMPEAWGAALQQRSFPGNIRELRNFIERSIALGWTPSHASSLSGESGGTAASGAQAYAGQTHPSHGKRNDSPLSLPLKEARLAWSERFEIEYLEALMVRSDGNVTRAAELAGINRRTLQRMLADYPEHFRKEIT